MDVKSEAITQVSSPAAAAPGVPAASGKHKASGAGEPDGAAAAPKIAAVQGLLREALNVEPVADRELRIEFERELRQIVVKVLDKESGKLIRQIPMPEEISIAKGLREAIRRMAGDQSGIAVNQEV